MGIGCCQVVSRDQFANFLIAPGKILVFLQGAVACFLGLAIWSFPIQAQQLQPKSSSDPYYQTKTVLTPQTKANVPSKLEPTATNSVPSADATLGGTNSNLGVPFEPGQVVAIVGGEPIFVADMLLEINQILDKFLPGAPSEIRSREQGNVVRVLVQKYVEQRLLAVDTKRDLPENVKWEQLIEQAGKDFDEKALPILMEKSGVNSPAAYDGNLRAMGSSLRRMRSNWCEEQIIRYFLGKKLEQNPVVTREEMLAFYEAHQADYHHVARARWEELMVRFDKCPDRQAALDKIVDLGNQVVYGASLAAVAEKNSDGFTAHRGGQYDWITKGSLRNKQIENEIFSMPLNQLSDLIESESGVHIIRVLEREEENTTPFVEVQSEIREKLLDEKRDASLQAHLEKVRATIPVEYIIEPAPRERSAKK